jgi:AcrR family transcriptional regulator
LSDRGTDTRQRLLEAGLSLLRDTSRGDLSRVLTTGAVAERAGVHRQTFYLHWASQAEYLDAFIAFATDPELSRAAARLATLADDMPTDGDDPVDEVRARTLHTYEEWMNDPVNAARIVLWALHTNDATVASRLRELYRTNDRNTAAGYKAIGDQWGLEPRPPFTYESIALLLNAIRDGLLLHLTIDRSQVPPTFIDDVHLALSWLLTRRIGDPDDTDSIEEMFRSDVEKRPRGDL